MSERFVMRPEHEHPHAPDSSLNFNESVYTNAFDATSPVGGWMRLGNRVNEGHAELSVCLYLPDGRIACQFKRPKITSNERFEAGGLKYQVIDPLRSVSMEYEGDLIIVDDPEALREPQALFAHGPRLPGHVRWLHEAESPVHGGEPVHDGVQTMYGRDFSLGHFNQHSRARGEIRVGDEVWAIDGRGWRDHSWGPRYWQAIYYYRLFIANFSNGDGFMLLKITDRQGKVRREGVLLVDGRYEEILDLDVMTKWTGRQDPAFVRLGVMTERRRVRIDGEINVLAPLRNRRKAGDDVLVSRIAEGFTRFDWEGRKGWGMTEYIERIEDGALAGFPI
ncbi:DUF7064 domain-containing protein [Arvimicrobium flavum]|uniref:DUF7064 domain-containing protein n=1 Tax=Arvimicrobium flavum TaxID=3393320 RepID=UPI00237B484F|nr:hypothetical protein [Mesorhizobium shangrilense]